MFKLLVGAAVVLAALFRPAAAHDIPEQLVLHGFVKPEGDRLHFLVRLPLVMLLSLNLPKRGPGFLDLAQIDDAPLQAAAAAAAKEIELYENGTLLRPGRTGVRISAASDRSFEGYAKALANIEGPKLPPSAEVFWNQGYFDAHLEYPIAAERSDFSLEMRLTPGLASRLKLIVRFLPPDGTTRAYQLAGDAGHVMLDPRWHQAVWAFIKFGFAHILDGVDHLLFLLCLVIPFRRVGWTLVGVITSFTLAHSVTLISAAYGIVPSGPWFPPLIEVLIAVSILYMAVENVFRPNLQRRWLITFAFGLVHGFGFSFLLKSQLQFAGDHLLTSLLAFNVGIELGQLLVLGVVLPPLVWLFNRASAHERAITVIASLLVGHTAWHWMIERTQALRDADWPSWAQAGVPLALGVSLVVLIGALAWIVRDRMRLREARSAVQGTVGAEHPPTPI